MISIDLNAALSNPKIQENLVLQEDNEPTKNTRLNLVKISGEVYFPTIIAYKSKKNLKYYIEKTENFTPFVQKKIVLVIQSACKSQSMKYFLWFKSYPSSTTLSETFVPKKEKNIRATLEMGELVFVSSPLNILANAILTVTK